MATPLHIVFTRCARCKLFVSHCVGHNSLNAQFMQNFNSVYRAETLCSVHGCYRWGFFFRLVFILFFNTSKLRKKCIITILMLVFMWKMGKWEWISFPFKFKLNLIKIYVWLASGELEIKPNQTKTSFASLVLSSFSFILSFCLSIMERQVFICFALHKYFITNVHFCSCLIHSLLHFHEFGNESKCFMSMQTRKRCKLWTNHEREKGKKTMFRCSEKVIFGLQFFFSSKKILFETVCNVIRMSA